MRLTRVHVAAPLAVGSRLALPEAAFTHLARVLRAREGDACVLFNGDGCDYDARIVRIDKRGAAVEVLGARRVDNESPLRIVLVQALARGEKMDLILQKATELGVAGFVPVESERSEVRLDGDRLAKRIDHWRSVVAAACEQSGRAKLPSVATPSPLAAALPELDDGSRWLLDPGAAQSPRSIAALPKRSTVLLAIGPEGGWSARDRAALHAGGFEGMRLGPRILRTETAGLAAIAALQARFGDLD